MSMGTARQYTSPGMFTAATGISTKEAPTVASSSVPSDMAGRRKSELVLKVTRPVKMEVPLSSAVHSIVYSVSGSSDLNSRGSAFAGDTCIESSTNTPAE